LLTFFRTKHSLGSSLGDVLWAGRNGIDIGYGSKGSWFWLENMNFGLFPHLVETPRKMLTIFRTFSFSGNSLGDVPWDGRNGIYIGYSSNGSWTGYQNPLCALWTEDLNAYLQTAGTRFNSANEIFADGGFHPSVLATMTSFLKLQNISSSSLPSAADLAKVKHLY
jgi:hypothetical protein